MPTIPAQTSALRLNATNIKSVLIKSNKSIDKLQEEKIRLLDRAAQRKERQAKEKAIESPIKGIVPTIGGAFSGLSGMAKPLYDKVIDVFGLLLLGFAVDKLPKIIETLTAAYNKVKPIFTIAMNTFKKIAGGFKNLLPVAESIMNFGKGDLNYDSQVKELEDIETEIDKDLDIFDNLFGNPVEPPEEKVEKEKESKDTGLFGSVGNFFKDLFKPKTPEPNKNVKEETGTEKTDLTKLVSENKTLVNGLRNRGRQQSGGATAGTREQRAMLAAVSAAEGTKASYGTIYGGKVVPELAQGKLTIGQVLEMQRTGRLNGRNVGYVRDQYDSDATGKYQFMSYVLKEEVQKQKLSLNTLFTPAMQDQIILGRLARFRGVTPQLLAREGMSDRVIDMLAPEFASFPNLFGPDNAGRVGTNSSYYGQGGKSAAFIKASYKRALGSNIAPSIQNRALPPAGNQSGGTNILILPFGIEKLIPLFQAPTESEVNSYRNRRNNRNRRGNSIP